MGFGKDQRHLTHGAKKVQEMTGAAWFQAGPYAGLLDESLRTVRPAKLMLNAGCDNLISLKITKETAYMLY